MNADQLNCGRRPRVPASISNGEALGTADKAVDGNRDTTWRWNKRYVKTRDPVIVFKA